MFSMFRGSTTSLGKAAFMVTTTAAGMSVASFITHRVTDTITGTCEFSEYTRRQCQKYPISGMHPPFITENEQARSQFHQHFFELSMEEYEGFCLSKSRTRCCGITMY